MAEGDIGAVIDTSIFDITRGMDPSIVHVSGDVFAVAYTGPDNDGWLCTFTIDSLGNIGGIIDTLEFDGADGFLPCIIHVTGNIFAIAYWQGIGTDDGIVATVNIDNLGNIGAAAIDTLTFDAVRGRYPDIIHVSGDIYAIAYRGPGDDGWLGTVTIDNLGNIGAGFIDTLEFDAVYGSAPSIIHISGDIYAIAYTGPDDDGWLCTVNIDNLGNIGAAVIDTLEYDNLFSNDQRIIHVAGDIYAIAYTRVTNPGRLCTVDIDNLGNIGAAFIDRVDFEPAFGIRISIVHVSGNVFALAYQGPDTDGWLRTRSIANDGTIGAAIDSLEFDPTYCDYPHIIYIERNIYAIAYTSALGGQGSIKTVDIETYRLPIAQTSPATEIT